MTATTDTTYTDRSALTFVRLAAEAQDLAEIDHLAYTALRHMELDTEYPELVDAFAIARHAGSALRARRGEIRDLDHDITVAACSYAAQSTRGR